jgi:hypothetical protein
MNHILQKRQQLAILIDKLRSFNGELTIMEMASEVNMNYNRIYYHVVVNHIPHKLGITQPNQFKKVKTNKIQYDRIAYENLFIGNVDKFF